MTIWGHFWVILVHLIKFINNLIKFDPNRIQNIFGRKSRFLTLKLYRWSNPLRSNPLNNTSYKLKFFRSYQWCKPTLRRVWQPRQQRKWQCIAKSTCESSFSPWNGDFSEDLRPNYSSLVRKAYLTLCIVRCSWKIK